MRAYERLLKYARVYTTSDPNSGTHPSAEREFDLAHILVEDLKAIGIEDAFVDEHCYVYGTLPATPGCEDKPALGLIAHMDTAPDASGENVNPVLHENYDGHRRDADRRPAVFRYGRQQRRTVCKPRNERGGHDNYGRRESGGSCGQPAGNHHEK